MEYAIIFIYGAGFSIAFLLLIILGVRRIMIRDREKFEKRDN
ncbi:MAG: hypothetical protein ACFB10_08115 [Salibacteraceae bacterium]